MPGTLREIARVFDAMQAKHRVMVDALRGAWTPDAEEALIDGIDRDGRDLAALLRDPARVRVSWVTLPEPMAIEETADAVAALASAAFLSTTSSSIGSRRNPIAAAGGATRGARWSGAPSAS